MRLAQNIKEESRFCQRHDNFQFSSGEINHNRRGGAVLTVIKSFMKIEIIPDARYYKNNLINKSDGIGIMKCRNLVLITG